MWSAYCANPQTRTSSPVRAINSSHRSCSFLPSFRMQIITDRGLHLGSMIAVVPPGQRVEPDFFCVHFFHICTVFPTSRRYIVMLLFYLYILLECNQTRSIAMLSGTLGNRAKCSGIRHMRVRHLLLQVAGTKAAACSRPIRLMGEAWKEQRGVAGRQRAKRHPDVISSSQTASQRTTMASSLARFSFYLSTLSSILDLSAPSFGCESVKSR